MNTIEKIRLENMKKTCRANIGDSVQVDVKIIEATRNTSGFHRYNHRQNGSGIAQTVTLRRVVSGQGVRLIPLHSPRIAGFKVIREGSVRRAKLYYLRKQVGKAAKVKAKRMA